MKINAKDGMIMKILMIEDNRSVCEMMSMFFKKEKWDATFAYDGEEAVEKFAAEADDWEMVLLDLNLPKKRRDASGRRHSPDFADGTDRHLNGSGLGK